MSTIFKVGDEVTCEAFYGKETFILKGTGEIDYPLEINKGENYHVFTSLGQFYINTLPLLKLVRTKEEIDKANKPKTFYEVFGKPINSDYAFSYSDSRLFESKEDFLDDAGLDENQFEWIKLREV